MNRINIEDTIKRIVASKGYMLNYEEVNPSSSEDMYEIKFWLEDRNLLKFDYKTIYIRNNKNPKQAAFKLLLNEYINNYYSDVHPFTRYVIVVENDDMVMFHSDENGNPIIFTDYNKALAVSDSYKISTIVKLKK